MSKLQSIAEDYFSQINPIASRIYADYQDTKDAYDCVWDTLSFDEQMQVLNESIIKPEVTLQYSLKTKPCETEHKSTVYAQKTIVDENILYRDEHSAPFSYKTASQIDLRLFESNKKQNTPPKINLPQSKVNIISSHTCRAFGPIRSVTALFVLEN